MALRLALFVLLFSAASQCADPIKMCQVDASTDTIITSACFTVPAEIVGSFDKYIATQTISTVQTDGTVVQTPAYSGFFDLVSQHFVKTLVGPILDIYPTADLKTLKDAAAAAQASIETIKSTALTISK
jgi:hypothetical protein